jgi:peptide/nickel transport system substrate-binding protein
LAGARYFDQAAVIVLSNLAEAGINFEIQALDLTTLLARVFEDKDFDATMMGDAIDPEPSSTLQNYFTTDGPTNIVGYSNPEVDTMMAAAVEVLAEEERVPLYRDIYNRIFGEDAAVAVVAAELFASASTSAVNIEQLVNIANGRYAYPILARSA